MQSNSADITKRVSVIVPVLNGEDTIGECLDSILDMEYPRELMEIIVVDNNSKDTTAEVLKKYPVKCVFEKKRSRASARNAGIREASGDFIAFVDADCKVDKMWLRNIMKGFYDSSIAACGGEESESQPRNVIEKYFMSRFSFGQRRLMSCSEYSFPILATFSSVFRKNIFYDVGFFDDAFITCEDVDMSLRMHKRGHKLNYVGDAVVSRRCPSTFRSFCRTFFNSGFYHAVLFYKYDSPKGVHSVFDVIRFNLGGVFRSVLQYIKKAFTGRKLSSVSTLLLDISIRIMIFFGLVWGVVKVKLGILGQNNFTNVPK